MEIRADGVSGETLTLPFSFNSSIAIYKWPKSGIPGAFVAEIGYVSISATSTTPGRHLTGQLQPPPDSGHISAGCTRFWPLDIKSYRIITPPYPKMAGLYDHNGPPRTIRVHASRCRRTRPRTVCLMLMLMRYCCTMISIICFLHAW